jgi:MscS family membrane protein
MRTLVSLLLFFSLLSACDAKNILLETPVLYPIKQIQALQLQAFEDTAPVSDEAIQKMFKENRGYLQDILLSIKEDPYSEGFILQDEFQKESQFLKSRIVLNIKLGNSTAVKRDEIALACLAQLDAINAYIIGLSSMVKAYASQKEIVEFSKKLRLDLPAEEKEGFTQIYKNVANDTNPLAEATRENFKSYISAAETYAQLLDFTTDNAKLLTQKTIFTLIHYSDIINSVNSAPSARWLNKKISFLYLNSGKLVAVVIVAILFWGSLHLSQWVLRFSFLSFKHYENNKLLRPIKLLLGVTALYYLILTLMYPLMPSSLVQSFIIFTYVFASAYLAMELLAYLVIGYFETKNSSENQKALVSLSIDMLKSLIIISAFVFYLNKMGVGLQTVLTSLGIFGIGIALAAKDSIANLFGSLNLLLDNTFSQGDFISIGTLEGEVVKVGLRSTQIRAFDNSLIIMPNAEAALKPIVNWSRRRLGREIKTSIAVSYNTDLTLLKEVIEEIRYMIAAHPNLVQSDDIERYENASSKALFVSTRHLLGLKKDRFIYLDKLDPSHMSVLVQVFSRSTDRDEWYRVKEELLYSILEILKKHAIEFALPAQTLYLSGSETPKKELVTSL